MLQLAPKTLERFPNLMRIDIFREKVLCSVKQSRVILKTVKTVKTLNCFVSFSET